MKLVAPQGLGLEPNKIKMLLAVILIGGPLVYYTNSGPDLPPGAAKQKSSVVPVGSITSLNSSQKAADAAISGSAVKSATTKRPVTRAANGSRSGDDFHPTLKLPEEIDVSTIDPTLKLELLAKVRAVGDVGGRRSLFEFYDPPPPPPKVQPIKPIPPAPPKPPVEPPKVVAVKPTPPPPTPVPFKFYGFSGLQRDIHKRGLFIASDGSEDIFIQPEDSLIRNRYKIVRLGVSSAEVEDTVAKNRQTLPLVDPVEK
ncbi:MAG: hypothetical protein ABI824_19740 [Acidobacteriota bacterium]